MNDDFEIILPDYRGGSIVNLMTSLGSGMGVPSAGHAPLRDLDPALVAAARHVVLLVIDGLGDHYIQGPGAGGALHAACIGNLTSVFPPTTAAAVTTYFTCAAPARHAITGWFMQLRELGVISAILPFRTRAGWLDLSGAVDIGMLIGAQPFANAIDRAAHIVTEKRLVTSAYSRATAGQARCHGHEGLDDMFNRVVSLIRTADSPIYLHAYWPGFDALSHRHGVGSDEVAAHFAAIDAAFARCMEQLRGTGTLLVACADHGFVDIAADHWLEMSDHPAAMDCLAAPLCGEPRAAYCYLRPGREAQFDTYVRENLDKYCLLYRSAELIESGWFGPGIPDPRLSARIGDRVLVMRPGYAVRDRIAGESAFRPVGVHGGVSEAEMFVPLIVASCK